MQDFPYTKQMSQCNRLITSWLNAQGSKINFLDHNTIKHLTGYNNKELIVLIYTGNSHLKYDIYAMIH